MIKTTIWRQVVGVEKEDSTLMTPDINVPFTEGDVVWVVGERKKVTAASSRRFLSTGFKALYGRVFL